MDKISIIIPIYNSSKYLKKCLDSVINQTYKNIEIILIDDASTDDSYDICLEYKNKDSRIKLLKNKNNKGASISRNIALKNISGNYITFVDSDDYVELDYIETMYKLIKEDNYDISAVGHTKFINQIIIKSDQNKKYSLNQEEVYKILFNLNENLECTVWAKLFKKELFNEVTFPEHKISNDVYVLTRILPKINKMIYSSVSKYNYVIRKGSISFNNYSIREMDRIVHTKELAESALKKYPNLTTPATIFLISNMLAVCNKQLFSNIYKSDVIKETKQIIKKNIFDILKSESSIIKKTQMILFLFNIRIYKIIYKRLKKSNVF